MKSEEGGGGGRREAAAALCPPSPSSSSFQNHLIQSFLFLLEIKGESSYSIYMCSSNSAKAARESE